MSSQQNSVVHRQSQDSNQSSVDREPVVHAPSTALLIQRAEADPTSLSAQDVQHLQRSIGNQATTHLLSPLLQRTSEDRPQHGPEGGAVDAGIAQTIQRAKGKGRLLDANVRGSMEQAFDADFGSVRIHNDQQADMLNRSLNAKAFTSGKDIFFRKGDFTPGTRGGKELLAHELTHVVQQNGDSVRRKVTFQRSMVKGRTSADTIQPARGKAGRVAGSLVSLLTGDLSARMTFGFRSDRKQIGTTTAALNQQNKPYTASNIQIGGGINDKYVLRGRRYNPNDTSGDGAEKAVILLSGSGGSNEDQMEPMAEYYTQKSSTVFGVNYRGYGGSMDKKKGKTGKKSESTPLLSERGLYDDARIIYNYVSTQGFADGNIIIHGFSLGGAVAANLAKSLAKEGKQLGGLVLHSSIDSSYKAARGGIPIPVLAQLGGLINKMSAGSFDTAHYLKLLGERDAALPVHFMSGKKGDGDDLALGATKLQEAAAKAGLSNVTAREGSGGHLDATGTHIPGGHLGYWNKQYLGEMLKDGRGRTPS